MFISSTSKTPLPNHSLCTRDRVLRVCSNTYLFKHSTHPLETDGGDPASRVLPALSVKFREGVYYVTKGPTSSMQASGIELPKTFAQFQQDLLQMWQFVKSAAVKAETFNRLQLLGKKIELYNLLNERIEGIF